MRAGTACRANARSDCGMRLLGPSASRLAPCSPPSRTLRVATRWPAAILDRGCARRPAHDQAGTKKRHSSRTKKLAPAWQGCYLRWWSRHFQEPPKFHSRRRGGHFRCVCRSPASTGNPISDSPLPFPALIFRLIRISTPLLRYFPLFSRFRLIFRILLVSGDAPGAGFPLMARDGCLRRNFHPILFYPLLPNRTPA